MAIQLTASNCGRDTLTLLMRRVTKRNGGWGAVSVPWEEKKMSHVKNIYVMDRPGSLQQVHVISYRIRVTVELTC